MRCPDCNKFVSNEELDAEVESEEVDEEGVVACAVRIANACGECGTELTEASFDLECDLSAEVAEHREAKHPKPKDDAPDDFPELTVEVASSERTSRTEGKGRGLRTFYGVKVDCTVTCACGWSVDGSADDDVQASGMESLA